MINAITYSKIKYCSSFKSWLFWVFKSYTYTFIRIFGWEIWLS